jgi:NTP pyrophosphatase (non-canonical NTP hydrolase)
MDYLSARGTRQTGPAARNFCLGLDWGTLSVALQRLQTHTRPEKVIPEECGSGEVRPEFGVTAMSGKQATFESLTERLVSFRDERDWRQFHSLKDLIVSLNLEAAEVLELIQWKNTDDVEQMISTGSGKARLAEECADVLLYLLLVTERAGIDLAEAASEKIAVNELKYPVEKSRGNAAKYSEL